MTVVEYKEEICKLINTSFKHFILYIRRISAWLANNFLPVITSVIAFPVCPSQKQSISKGYSSKKILFGLLKKTSAEIVKLR